MLVCGGLFIVVLVSFYGRFLFFFNDGEFDICLDCWIDGSKIGWLGLGFDWNCGYWIFWLCIGKWN